ncbi:uncharacterized protein LOC143029260 [Oratosquilla oratoria]|uniref:uncharacterized protein LOC143029260 n=1 Tax=Oratosquilla oratoria TaxID=337810 RepID=UPI003F75FD92
MVVRRFRISFPHILGLFLLVFVLFRKGQQLRDYKLFIPNQDPNAVWDVVADFSNIAKMNKRIRNWELLEEEGTWEKWSYKVISYEGMLGESILGLNVNHGLITVEPINPPDHYYIQCVFDTKSFRGLVTVNNWSKMNFRRVEQDGQKGTLYEEKVGMDCPLIFSPLCIYETDIQRAAFLENLQNWFE